MLKLLKLPLLTFLEFYNGCLFRIILYTENIFVSLKILKDMTPENMNVFRYVNQVSSRETRNSVSGLLYVPKSRTGYYKRSFRISTAILWNQLPDCVRTCNIMSSFKTKYLQQ